MHAEAPPTAAAGVAIEPRGSSPAGRVRALVRALLGALCCSAVPACIPASAGLSDLRSALPERVRSDVRWHAVDPAAAPESDRRVRRLLEHPLDAEGASRVALLRNPRVQAALGQLGIARGQLLQASLLPSVTAGIELRFPTDDNEEVALESEALIDLGAMLRVPLRRSAAEAELRAASMEAASSVLALALETRVAFYHYQAAVQIQTLFLSVVEAQRAAWEAAQLLREAGNVRVLDVVQQRVLYEEARLALANTELAVLDARERLNVLMGLWGDETEWRAQPALLDAPAEQPDLERIEARAVGASLTLAALEQRAQGRARQIGVAQSFAALPELRAGVAVNREDGNTSVGPALEIALPIFGQQQGTIASEEARLEQLRARHMAEAIRVRSSVRRARNTLLNAHRRVVFYRDTLLPVRAELVEQTLLQYNAMQADVFQLLAARRAQIEANAAYFEALRDYWIADAGLAQILAGGSAEPSMGSSSSLPRLPGGSGGEVGAEHE